MRTDKTPAQHFADSLFADSVRRALLERDRIAATRAQLAYWSDTEPDTCFYGCGQRARVNSYYCSVECAIRAESEAL